MNFFITTLSSWQNEHTRNKIMLAVPELNS